MPEKRKTVKTGSSEAPKRRSKIAAKLKGAKTPKTAKSAYPNTVSHNRLELLITVVNRSKGEYYIDLLQSFDVNMQFVALGQGTADRKMLAMFGLTDSEKTVIFSVIQEDKLDDALAALSHRFNTIKNGKGVAYSVPLSGVVGKLIFGFLSNNRMTVTDVKEK